MRWRNPWVFARLRVFGWKVRFMVRVQVETAASRGRSAQYTRPRTATTNTRARSAVEVPGSTWDVAEAAAPPTRPRSRADAATGSGDDARRGRGKTRGRDDAETRAGPHNQAASGS